MGRFFVEKMVVPALQALREPKEQVYLGLTLATVLVLLFGPGGVTTRSQATNTSGHYNTPKDVFAKDKGTTPVVPPGPKHLDPVYPLSDQWPRVEPEALKPNDFARAKPTTPVIEPGPKHLQPFQPSPEFKLQEEPKPAMSR